MVKSELLFLVIVLFCFSCKQNNNPAPQLKNAAPADTLDRFEEKIEVKYAKGFTVQYDASFVRLKVLDPSNAKLPFATYLLVNKGDAYSASSDAIVLERPLQNMASVSTTHLAFLSALDLSDKLVGFSGIRYIKDTSILNRVAEGKVKELGTETDLNHENVIDLSPDFLMVYPYEGMDYSLYERAGIPVVFNSDYLEMHPLGKAEWIKFVGLLFGKEKEANRIFARIEKEYNEIQALSRMKREEPSIFSGKAFNGEWHAPGGKSFAATLLMHAGTQYVWKSDAHNNVFQLDMETVLNEALDAEWWVIVGAHKGEYALKDLEQEDDRYREFAAFKKGKVLFCNTFSTDYFGQGILEPHIILRDLIHFIHPELAKDHKPVYFYKLK